MLEIQNLSKKYAHPTGGVDALVDVSLHVSPGEFVGVQGPSGCGKSTLLLAAGGLLAGDLGKVLLDGQDPYAMDPDARAALRARKVGFVFQQFHLVPYLSVIDNVMSPSLALRTDGAAERAKMLIEQFGLADRAHHKPAELSTGERQRTALARALLNEPGIILADEPTGNLDSGSARDVLEYLTEFVENGGAVLLVTHDDRAAVRAQRTVFMRAGRIVEG